MATTISKQDFLIADSRGGNQRVISFGSRQSMIYLSRSDLIIMDGTFFVVPSIFYQLYTLFGMVGTGNSRRSFPLVYALMSNKTASLYRRLLEDIKSYCIMEGQILEPKFFLTDFEKAAIKACKEVCPDSEQHGCLFHYGQINFRSIVSHKLVKEYGENVNFTAQIRKIIAMAFLRPEQIEDAFENIILWMKDDMKTTEFLNWFKNNYISSTLSRRASQSKTGATVFSQEFWSVCSLIE